MPAAPSAVLLDRDGTINRKAESEDDYIVAPGQVVLLPGAAEAVRRLNLAGVPVAVVTNQRGIALGRMTEGDLRAVHDRLDALLAAGGARVDGYYHCPHDRDCRACRKPAPGLLHRAARELGVGVRSAAMVGDRPADLAAGRAAGALTVGIGPRTAGHPADLWAPDLGAAVERLLAGAYMLRPPST